MSLICSSERTSDGEEGDVGEEEAGMDHFEELNNGKPCGAKNVI